MSGLSVRAHRDVKMRTRVDFRCGWQPAEVPRAAWTRPADRPGADGWRAARRAGNRGFQCWRARVVALRAAYARRHAGRAVGHSDVDLEAVQREFLLPHAAATRRRR